MLRPIRLSDLRQMPGQTQALQFKQFFAGFESLTPVEGSLEVSHRGHFLEVSAEAHTIVTLTCHRCLQQFNHRLHLAVEEIILIREPSSEPLPLELELQDEADLLESLPCNGELDVEDWMYQHLHLQMPRQLPCRPDCPGIGVESPAPAVDPRWAALASFLKDSP
ncbi:YceD family protein [Synechococcus sp. H55.7]|uniref:YceD family protein n=1 Tax=unclassified Synechococcus TaxID=2626047 RepID=UPI0039C318A7